LICGGWSMSSVRLKFPGLLLRLRFDNCMHCSKQISLWYLDAHVPLFLRSWNFLQDLVSAIEDRGLKIGKAMFRELTGLRKPALDKNNILHWPVLLLYAEVMSSDFIEDFCETDMFSAHLDMISFLVDCYIYLLLFLMSFVFDMQCPSAYVLFLISWAFKHVFRKLSTIAMGQREKLQPWIYWVILWGKRFYVILVSVTIIAFSTF
jgi:hypothetical protein